VEKAPACAEKDARVRRRGMKSCGCEGRALDVKRSQEGVGMQWVLVDMVQGQRRAGAGGEEQGIARVERERCDCRL
jgi:hypothetical protein